MERKRQAKEPVNQFAIYEISISEIEQKSMFSSMDPALAVQKAPELFEGIFKGARKLDLQRGKKAKDGSIEAEHFPNDIISVHENVYFLRIHNNKKQKVVEKTGTSTNGVPDYEENTYISNPYCYVVIDNRYEKGICQMAIQKNSAWGDTNRVRKLLQHTFNREFGAAEIPLKVTIAAKMRPSKIWEFCKQRCSEGEDVIQRITFDFPNQAKLTPRERIANPQGYIKHLSRMMELTDAIKTHISVEYSNADPEAIEKNADNLANIVRICKNTTYNLSIYFRSYGIYKCDDQVRAMYPMKQELLDSFRANWEELPYEEKYGLFNWCNYVYEQSKQFDHVERIPTKRRRKHS